MVNKFKIILQTGRELGPLGENEVKKLIKKGIITGKERARFYPKGEWMSADQIPELMPLFMEFLQEELGIEKNKENQVQPLTHQPIQAIPGTTVVLQPDFKETPSEEGIDLKIPKKVKTKTDTETPQTRARTVKEIKKQPILKIETPQVEEKKIYFHEEDMTQVEAPPIENKLAISLQNPFQAPMISSIEKTVLFSKEEVKKSAPLFSEEENSPKTPQGIAAWIRIGIIGVGLGYLLNQVFQDPPKSTGEGKIEPISAQAPRFLETPAQPDASEKLYQEGMKDYYLDNVKYYKRAIKKLHLAISLDKNNVRALSMLASTYLNLVDAAHKKDNYFKVVKDLIELARAKNLDLLETVIADIEFYITVDQLKAAESRIVDFTRGKENFPPEMYFYLSYVYFLSNNYEEAKKFLSRFDGEGEFFFGPRVLYLKGKIFEKLGKIQDAEGFYKKNLSKFPEHAKSILALMDVLKRQGKEIEGASLIEVLLKNKEYLTAIERAHALYLSGMIHKGKGDLKHALMRVQEAVQYEPENSEYILEYFSLRARIGDSDPQIKSKAKLFYFLSEGERLFQKGDYENALQSFLKASFEDQESALPYFKMGEVFFRKKQLRNAIDSYKKAVTKAPKNMHYWSNYIQVLLESYEWEQVDKVLKILYSNPQPKSASLVRKIRGLISAKQGRHADAVNTYKIAMSYEEVDTDVYIAYAQSLLALKEFDQARFFFSLGRRFDPLNLEAVFGTAQAISLEKSIDEAIQFLEQEFKKLGEKNAEILSQIAEFRLQKGDLNGAKNVLENAKKLDPNSAFPYRVEGELELINKNDKKSIERALSAFKYYSDRNQSDPMGYLKRFEIFMQTGDLTNARTELDLVFKEYPRYPGLHYLYGQLYIALGSKSEALAEFNQEIENHPGAYEAMLQLGILQLEAGEPKTALGMLIRADQIRGGQWADAKSWAGYANFLMKNYEGAVALYLSAIQIDAGNPIHYKRLGQAQWAQGDQVSARQAFAKYLQLAPDAPDRAEVSRYL